MREGWETKPLGEVIRLEYGKPLPKEKRTENGHYPVYGANGVKSHSEEYYWDKPSIIVGRKGSAGEVVLSQDVFWPLDVTYFVVYDDCKYDRLFLFYALKSLHLNRLAKVVKPGLNRNEVYSIDFPTPPLPEQKRIVAILDEAFAAIETAVANAEKNLANARELFDSYLNGVFSRKGDGWVEKRLGDVCDLMTGGTPSKTKPEFFENGNIKWLVSGDIHQREIFNCKGRITESGLKNSNAKYLPINSVMIALNGQGKTRGSVALLRTKATCNQSLVSIYPKNTVRILPEYIQINLQGRYQEIRHITGDSGNDRRGLNMKLVRNIKIPIAPPTEQQIIVSSLNEIESEVRHLEEIYQQKLDSLGELEQSILHKAFSGELTDGADEILEEAGV